MSIGGEPSSLQIEGRSEAKNFQKKVDIYPIDARFL
jgi:hypothetical protein